MVVEIFPQKKEFAVRTFGLPGAEGFLGVCFGRVITANSPASQGEHPSNWESVLWHEYCHVVTLNKTRNKMPRWLSEGISVYEEGLAGPGLGRLDQPEVPGDDPRRRPHAAQPAQLGVPGPQVGDAHPVRLPGVGPGGRIPGREAGLDALKGVLDDLGDGVGINESLPSRTEMTIDNSTPSSPSSPGPRRRPSPPRPPGTSPSCPPGADSKALGGLARGPPQKLPRPPPAGLEAGGRGEVARGEGGDREAPGGLSRTTSGEDNAYLLLAAVCRKTSDPAGERAALEALAALDGSAGPAYLRLMELEEAAGDWKGMARDARRLLAVNPLIPPPFRRLARASEELGRPDEALAAYRALALVDESDPADIHYRLAKLLQQGRQAGRGSPRGPEVARRGPAVPRAHRLLLELVGPGEADPARRPPGPRAPSHDPTATDLALIPLALASSPARRSGRCGSAGRRRARPDPRGPRGGAQLEGRRAVQVRRLHLRPGRVRLDGRRPAAAGFGGATAAAGAAGGPPTSPTAT